MDNHTPMFDVTAEPPDVVIKPQEEYGYGYIMEVLTSGLYPDKLHVIREYVQNAYDAILEQSRQYGDTGEGRIEIRVETPSIFIYDEGIGMDATGVAKYRYVGYSEKLTHESVGFRGIGKLSGISVAEKIIVSTTRIGVPQRFRLVFDAEAMLARVQMLKQNGQNIALNQLIRDHTSLDAEYEDAGAHYTLIELHNIRSDSQDLMNADELAEYISLTAPVDFDPRFQFGAEIDEALRRYVPDYDTAQVSVNGERIFKPFLTDTKPPQWLFVWPDREEIQSPEDMEDDFNTIAVCWYCEHVSKGQYPDKQRRGLWYRVKNFAIGDNQLARTTLWRNTPERAFYFFGEIHVCDPEVTPSADRTNFEHNEARDRMYVRGSSSISPTLNKIAEDSSAEKSAKEFILRAEEVVADVGEQVQANNVPLELRTPKIVEVSNAVREAKKRLKKAPDQFRKRGEQVIAEGQRLVRQLDQERLDGEHQSGVYDIQSALDWGEEARHVYQIIIDVLSDEFGPNSDTYEQLITKIHERLRGGQEQ